MTLTKEYREWNKSTSGIEKKGRLAQFEKIKWKQDYK